jgi:hypothetical protein
VSLGSGDTIRGFRGHHTELRSIIAYGVPGTLKTQCAYGQTAIGGVTVSLLHINDELRVELREAPIAEGLLPA